MNLSINGNSEYDTRLHDKDVASMIRNEKEKYTCKNKEMNGKIN